MIEIQIDGYKVEIFGDIVRIINSDGNVFVRRYLKFYEGYPSAGDRVLFKMFNENKNAYLRVGALAITFTPPDNDNIINYYCNYVNGEFRDYAIGEKYVYIFEENVYMPIEYFNLDANIWQQYNAWLIQRYVDINSLIRTGLSEQQAVQQFNQQTGADQIVKKLQYNIVRFIA